MPNYQFLDAYGSVLSAGSSIIGGVNYPQVYIQGSVATAGVAVANQSVSGTVGVSGTVPVTNAPISSWVQGIASCFTGVIQPVIAAQGASIFTYVTSAQVTNASANNVYLTIYGATSSVVSYLPVPANSGAIPTMVNGWKSNANGAFSASVSGVASVFIAMQGFTNNV